MNRPLLLAAVILAALLAAAGERIVVLERAIAAKPKIEYREKIVERKVKVAGAVRVEERIVQVPGGERVTERVVYRDAVTTETDRAKDTELHETAACPAPARSKRWIAAVELGPRGGTVPIGGRAGVTLFDTLDLTGGYRKDGQDRLFLDAGLRF